VATTGGTVGPRIAGPDPPGRWPALLWLGSATLLAMTTWFSATAVVPQLQQDWSLSTTAGASLTLAVQLGFVAGALASAVGNLADLVPPTRLLLLGALGAAACNAGLLLADSAAQALPLRFLTGAFLAGVYPPALKQMATWFRVGRGTALGLMVGALTLGSALPHLVNGLGGAQWQAVIATTSVLTVIGGIIAATRVPDGPFPFPAARFDPRQIRLVVTDRGTRLASLGYFGHMWELYAMWAWFAVFVTDVLADRRVTEATTLGALLTFIVIGAGALGCWGGGVLGDRWGRTRSTILAMALSGSCAVLVGLLRTGPLWLLLAVSVLWGVTVVADSAQFSTIVTEVADQRYVGTALTLQLAAGFTLTGFTILLVPWALDALTWQWAFAVLAPGPFLGIVAMLRLQRSPQARLIAMGRG
jgi:MFS family permease